MEALLPAEVLASLNGDASQALVEAAREAAADLTASSKETFRIKSALIENAEDMSTQEKLIALDAANGRFMSDMALCLLIPALACVGIAAAVYNPAALKPLCKAGKLLLRAAI